MLKRLNINIQALRLEDSQDNLSLIARMLVNEGHSSTRRRKSKEGWDKRCAETEYVQSTYNFY